MNRYEYDNNLKITFNEVLSLLNNIKSDEFHFHIYPRKLVRINNQGIIFKIIEFIGEKNNGHTKLFKVKFVNSGYEKIKSLSDIIAGSVYDPLSITCCGIGYLGEKYKENRKADKSFYLKMYKRWFDMIQRCYDPLHHAYSFYGGLGVKVCKEWHNFSTYFEDIKHINGYDFDLIKNGKLELDKDIKQSKIQKSKQIYSPETCIWISKFDNVKAVSDLHPHILNNLKYKHNRSTTILK